MGNVARRVLGILTLGGSFTGFVITLQQVVTTEQPATGVLFSSGFGLLYAWGCWCGVRLLENHARSMHMGRIFWALQLPVLVSPGLSYYFSTGSFLAAGVNLSQDRMFMTWQLGSQFKYGILDGSTPTLAGINLVAAGVVFYLSYCLYLVRLGLHETPAAKPAAPVAAAQPGTPGGTLP
jgi:hypothetical protein